MLNPNDPGENDQVVRDGMDISVCSICKNSKNILFAGANNKMFLVRTSTSEVIEIAADSMPAGHYESMHPFKLQKTPFIEGDVAILCSDGFKDQFGGPEGKKFLVKRFKQLLLTICNQTTEPEKILEQTFLNWKGENEQIDDVMVLGFFLKD
jgi:sigma-B regulation protein RsbU (phosphoserine phosphatase)